MLPARRPICRNFLKDFITVRLLRSAILILLIALSPLSLLNAEWLRVTDFSKGIATNPPLGELTLPYAMQISDFEIQSKSLIQIKGASLFQTSKLGNNPVRGLYRYYDESTDAKRTIAVCGGKLFSATDGDTFSAIGTSAGKIKVTNGSKNVYGVWGTDWDYWLGDANGYGYQLRIAGVDYPVYRITSYRALTLQSNFSDSTSDSVAYRLIVPVNDTNFVGFAYWRDRMFVADGDNQVRLWTHDRNLDYSYWIVDSLYVSSVSTYWLTTSAYLKVNYDKAYHYPTTANGTKYDDSSFAIVIRDSCSVFSLHQPLPIQLFDGGAAYFWVTLPDTGVIDTTNTSCHYMVNTWAYIVSPRNPITPLTTIRSIQEPSRRSMRRRFRERRTTTILIMCSR